MNINFDGKTFLLSSNSDNGEVDTSTVFKYQQKGHLVTADYYGGSIEYGKIIAQLQGENLNMLYQCLTTAGELKAGKAVAQISFLDNKKMKLTLSWAWLEGDNREGISVYLEQ